MNLRNLLLLAWAIDHGGLPRFIAILAIVMFVGFFGLMFLCLIGGPGEILRHLHSASR